MSHSSHRRPAPLPPTAATARLAPLFSDAERRAILGVCDCLIGAAGRTVLAMALRGSRAQRVLRHHADQARGYGFYAGVPEADVLARIDALIAEGLLCLRFHDGFPLLSYTTAGLELAQRYAAEAWLAVLRTRVQPVADGVPLELPFLPTGKPERNLDTVHLLIDLVARTADRTWLPLLRAWQTAETRRVRGWLTPIIAALEQDPPANDHR